MPPLESTPHPTAGRLLPRSGAGGAMMAIASMFCVQLGLALSVHLFDQLGPLGTAWLRLAWAGVLLLVLVRPRPSDFTRKDLLASIVLGVATAGLMIFFMHVDPPRSAPAAAHHPALTVGTRGRPCEDPGTVHGHCGG